MKFQDKLIQMGACREAVQWVGDKTMQEAWATCERGDWMLWLYTQMYPDNKRERVLAAAHRVNLIRHPMTDKRSRQAVDVAIAYGEGRATEDELRTATHAAYTDHTVCTTSAVAPAVAPAVAYAAKEKTKRQCADICREYLQIDIGSDGWEDV